MKVSLWSAKIPFIGKLATHHWFVIEHDDRPHIRWEVWQSTDAMAGGEHCDDSNSWGHLYKNLMPPTAWAHRDTPLRHHHWSGSDAIRIAQRIDSSPHEYPWCHKYRYWPGPNSNTYVQWVLKHDYRLSWRAAGKHYSRLA